MTVYVDTVAYPKEGGRGGEGGRDFWKELVVI